MVPCGKIIALPDNDRLWRRFINSKNYWTWDDDLNRYIPNRHYLKFNPDLSSYWNWHLAMHGLGAESVLEGDDRYTIVGELSIGKMRRRDFIVHHTPRKDTENWVRALVGGLAFGYRSAKCDNTEQRGSEGLAGGSEGSADLDSP